MTSLTETLPILDQAVPGLPVALEGVSQAAEAFLQFAGATLDDVRDKRAHAESWLDQLTRALGDLEDKAAHRVQELQNSLQSLDEAADKEAGEIERGTHQLTDVGDHAATAFDGLQGHLVQAADRTRSAHQDARAALKTVDDQARAKQAELDGAVREMATAVHSAQQAIGEGQHLVEEGLTALTEAMTQMLSAAHDRLGRSQEHFSRLDAEQMSMMAQLLTDLETRRAEIGQLLDKALAEANEDLVPELQAAYDKLTEMEHEVLELTTGTASHRDALDGQLKELGSVVPVLQYAVDQVKQAALQLGISWP